VANLALVVGVVGAALYFLVGTPKDRAPAETGAVDGEVAEQRPLVRLPAQKISAAKITVQAAMVRSITHMHTVPGRLEYDAARRLDVRLPTDCVVKEVCVNPGQHVQQGDRLAVLTSEQIGLARDDVAQAQEALEISEHHLARTTMIEENVARLLAAFKQRPSVTKLEADFADRPLDEHRSELFGAYSDFLLAEQVHKESSGLSDRGVLSERVLQERRAKLEKTQAAFQGACEETSHHAHVAQHTSEVEVARAKRTLEIHREGLAALLGPYAEKTSNTDTGLNELVLTAPFSGRVTARRIAASEVVTANSTLFTLADTSRLWVTAQIREQDWSATSLRAGQTVQVRTPATGDQQFTATVDFIGAEVDPETRAVPLVATLENNSNVLKPGMFVWVSLPVESDHDALAVPSSSVIRHDNQAFVFVAEGDTTFRRVDVTTGVETKDWTEVRSGLSPGQMVAASGTFVLKSEILLEREES